MLLLDLLLTCWLQAITCLWSARLWNFTNSIIRSPPSTEVITASSSSVLEECYRYIHRHCTMSLVREHHKSPTSITKLKSFNIALFNTRSLIHKTVILISSWTTNWIYSVSLKPGLNLWTTYPLIKPPLLDVHTWTTHSLRAGEAGLLPYTDRTWDPDHSLSQLYLLLNTWHLNILALIH